MKVYIRKDESLDNAIDRFNQKVKRAAILEEYRGKSSYKSASEKRHDRDQAHKQKARQRAK